jgi:hypothetical protein
MREMEKEKITNRESGEYCRVSIRVRSETKLGQTVAVSGSTHQLGYFDKEKVIQLVTSPDSYPVWYTLKPIVLPRHQLVYYKFCVMEAGSVLAFENRAPRSFMPDEQCGPKCSDCIIEDDFNSGILEGNGLDSETDLLAEIKALTSKTFVDVKESDRLLGEELAGKKMIIVCYHLPVVVTRTGGKFCLPRFF